MDTRPTAALIPAAGTSARMGELKPLLPLAGKAVIENSIDRLRSAGVACIRVVVGHRAAELTPIIEKAGALWIENPGFSSGMLSSIQTGLRVLPENFGAFFVLPADMPLFRVSTIAALREAGSAGRAQICFPTFEGRRGHPPLLAMALKERILAWHGEGGLQGFMENLNTDTLDVPVADEGILLDLDTPEDYHRACRRAEKLEIPTEAECLALMTMRFGQTAAVIRHCRAVATIALTLAAELNRAGCDLDPDLVQAAGLLHDVAKGKPDHAAAGATLLSALGFDRVAAVVGEHMNLAAPRGGPLDERELVYLADKLVQGDRLVAMQSRFEDKLDRHGDDPLIRSAIIRRRDQATAVKARIEKWLQQPLESVLSREKP